MSTGPFLTAAAVALAVSVSAISAGASDDKKASHTPSAYSLSFPPHGPVCSSSNNAQAVAEAIHGNPFAAFAGSGAYSTLFFNGNQGVSGGGGGSLASVSSSGSVSGSGEASTGAPSVVLVPGAAGTVTSSQTATAPLVTTTQVGGVIAQSTPSATPEPATLLLLGAGLGGVLVSRRRTRKAD